MLRTLFRRPRTVRVPIDNHNVGVQKVNVRRPSSTALSRFVLMGAITTLTIQGMKYLDPLGNYQSRDIFQEQLNKATKENVAKKKDSLPEKQSTMQYLQNRGEDVETSSQTPTNLRFTIPIWIRKGEPRAYKAWDPEFKDFARLQSDENRISELRQQVFDALLDAIKANPSRYGELKIIGFNGKIAGSLDVVPQLLAPALYQVPCLWIAMDRPSIYFDWRELEQETGARIERVFRPIVVLEAATSAATTFLRTMYAITKAKLTESQSPASSSTSAHAKTNVVATKADTAAPIKSPRPIFPSFPDLSDGPATRKMHQDIVSAMPYSQAIERAAFAFNHVKTMRQKATISANLKGVCQIRGYITFYGTRGKFKMEIIAHYLPGENVFVGAVQVKQRFIAQDFGAMQKLKVAMDQKKAAEAAKKALEAQKEKPTNESPVEASDPSVRESPPHSKHDGKEKE